MTVLHLNENYDIKGGTEVYIHQLQELLPQSGVTSFFIGVYSSNRKKYEIKSNSFYYTDKSWEETINIIGLFLENQKIEIIHIHGISDSRLITFCLKNRPVIRSMHEPRMFCPGNQKFWVKSETICNKPAGLHCFKHAITQRCQSVRSNKILNAYRNVNYEINKASKEYKYILAMSNYMKNEALLAGIHADKIVEIPYFTPYINEQNNIECTGAVKRILFIGRLHPSKGPHVLIRSIKEILKSSNDIVLEIIGDGVFKDELKKLVRNEDIPQHKVLFFGWLNHDKIIEKIQQSYLVVFPSIYPEAFGIVGIEAMMCSKPVVAFNVGGVSTWLQNDITGFLIKVKDEFLLCQKIEELINDKKLYKKFSHNARKIAVENYIPKIHIEKLLKLYENAMCLI